MPVSNKLLDYLVCPVTGDPLIYDKVKQRLICKKSALAYPIINNIPIMVASEAKVLENK